MSLTWLLGVSVVFLAYLAASRIRSGRASPALTIAALAVLVSLMFARFVLPELT